MIPNGMPSLFEASPATSCPTRVTLNAVFLIVSHNSSNPFPRTCSIACFTTPGPLTPTLITASPSVTPRNAPAMNGLSSGALQNTTSFAQPSESFSFVASAVAFTISPHRRTASILIPVFVDPTLIELQILSVHASACGTERIRFSSLFVIDFETRAE